MNNRQLSVDIWLVVSKSRRWGKLDIRLAIKQLSLKPGEVPIKAKVEIPESVFLQPQFKVTLAIPEPEAIEPDVKIDRQLAHLAKKALGVTLFFEQLNSENNG